jgi:hypothetical protein
MISGKLAGDWVNLQEDQHMPDRVQVGHPNLRVEAAECSVVDPNHDCRGQNYHCSHAELVNLLRVDVVLLLDSVELLEKQPKCWNDKTHQRKRIHNRIVNGSEGCRYAECQHKQGKVFPHDFWKISTGTEENHRAGVTTTKNVR